MWTELYWINDVWPGRPALAARPRGGDWLRDEMASWRQSGIDVVLSLLTPEEENDLDLMAEERESNAQGMEFVSYPIPDRDVRRSEAGMSSILDRVDRTLSSGKNVIVHARPWHCGSVPYSTRHLSADSWTAYAGR